MKTSPTKDTRSKFKIISLSALGLLTPALARAHQLPGEAHGFASGFNHPLHGADHLLAMVAVGLWAAQLGGRSRWLVPASFVTLMAVAGALGMGGVRLPMAEAGILISVLGLGVLLALAVRLPLIAAMTVAGVFAIFHGHAHGVEIPPGASGLAYGLGFVLATAALHACGIGLGTLAQKRMTAPILRYAGAAIALAGVGLWLA
jgi:urease accessory protein